MWLIAVLRLFFKPSLELDVFTIQKLESLADDVRFRRIKELSVRRSGQITGSIRRERASGFWADDYVLAARFAYLQEAIDYCLEGSKRGVRMKLISRLVPESL